MVLRVYSAPFSKCPCFFGGGGGGVTNVTKAVLKTVLKAACYTHDLPIAFL